MSKLKIGIIAVDFYPQIGGMENYAAQLVENFRDMGHDVHLFIKVDGQEISGVNCHKCLTKDLNVDLPQICQHDMDVWLAINSSYGLLARYKSNVFICAHGNDFLAPWVLFEFKWLQKRFIWRFKRSIEKFYFNVIRQKYIHKVSGVFANSDYTLSQFVQRFPKLKDKSIMINPGVDPNFFLEPKKQADESVHIISVARLTNSRKNIQSIIHALARFKDDYNYTYSVIGDGREKSVLEELVKELHLEDKVFIKGRISYEDLKSSYQNADLFVLTPWTSSKDIEGFGMVYLEANASGVPVLASRGNGSSSAINEGVSGYFVDDPNPDECYKALKTFFDKEIVFDVEKVIAHAEPFRWKNIAQKFMDGITKNMKAGA